MLKQHENLAEKRASIASARLFRGVEAEILEQLATVSEVRALAAGEILITPEVRNSHIYLVVQGALSVCLTGIDESEVASIGPSQCCGEISVIDEQSPSAYVVAGRDCIVLSIGREDAWHAINNSAVLPRNFLYVMSRRIRNYRDMVVEKTESSIRDSLTGVFNRRWLDDELVLRWSRAVRENESVSLLMVDADYFKRFNDQHGHVAGDQALQGIAGRLQSAVRQQDGVARYGGEEFCVLLAGVSRQGALDTAERIRSSIADESFRIEEQELPITVSIGVSTISPIESLGIEKGIRRWVMAADQALYQAKGAGRNRVMEMTPVLKA